MKKLIFGVSLMFFGAILIASALIAGSIYSAGANQALNTVNFGIFDASRDYGAIVLFFAVIGALLSVAGIILAAHDIFVDKKDN